MRKLKSSALWAAYAVIFLLAVNLCGCGAAMNTDVKSMPGVAATQKYAPRVAFEKMEVYDEGAKPDKPYIVVGTYVGQESTLVMTAQSPKAIARHLAAKAHKDGADAIMITGFTVAPVAGGYARTTPVITIKGIRYHPL